MTSTYTSGLSQVRTGDETDYTVGDKEEVGSTAVRWRGITTTSEETRERSNFDASYVSDDQTAVASAPFPDPPPDALSTSYYIDFTFDNGNLVADFKINWNTGTTNGAIETNYAGSWTRSGGGADENGNVSVRTTNDTSGDNTIGVEVTAVTEYVVEVTDKTTDPTVDVAGGTASYAGALADGETTDWITAPDLQNGSNTFAHSIAGSGVADFEFRYVYYKTGAKPIAASATSTDATIEHGEITAAPAGGGMETTAGTIDIPDTAGWWATLVTPDDMARTLRADELLAVDVEGEHTAAWGATIKAPPILDLDRFRAGSMLLYYGGERRLRCPEIIGRDEATDGTLTVDALGESTDLTEYSVDREFADALGADAIRTLLRADAGFADSQVTVADPLASPIDGEIVQSANTRSEFDDVLAKRSRSSSGQYQAEAGGETPNWQPTDPFAFALDSDDVITGVRVTQTCHTREAESFDGVSGVTTTGVGGASGAAVVEFADTDTEASDELAFAHDVPEGSFGVSIRARAVSTSGSGTTTIRVRADDQQLVSFPADALTVGSGFGWLHFNTEYQPGDEPFAFRIDAPQIGDARVDVDCVAVYDDRFSYSFDDTTDANDALAGPELFPDAAPLRFTAAPAGIALDKATATATFDAAGAATTLGVEYTDGAATATSVDGTTGSHTAAFDATTTRVRPTVTLSRHSDDRATTPTRGNQPQTLESIETSISGNAVPVIESRSFEATTVFDAVQSLCNEFDFNWVVEHGTRPEDFAIEVFERGDPRRRRALPADAVVLDSDESAAAENYANEVTVLGAEIPDSGGDRYRWTERDETEIERLGPQPATPIENDELTTVNDCRAVARSELAKRLDEDERGGNLSVTPSIVEPGYPYRIEAFEDTDIEGWGAFAWGEDAWGSPAVFATLESSSFSESTGSASTDLDLDVRSDVLAALAGGF